MTKPRNSPWSSWNSTRIPSPRNLKNSCSTTHKGHSFPQNKLNTRSRNSTHNRMTRDDNSMFDDLPDTAEYSSPVTPPPLPPQASTDSSGGNGHMAAWSTHSPQQRYYSTAFTTNEPFAITMLIVLLVIGLGIVTILVVLLYRMFAG